MKTFVPPSPIVPRRIEVSLEPKEGELETIFIDTVDENFAREVVAFDKTNPESAGNVAVNAAAGASGFTNQQQRSFAAQGLLESQNQHSRRGSSDVPLLPRKCPGATTRVRKMVNVGGGVEPIRSALTPRSDTQANGGSLFQKNPVSSSIMKDPTTTTNGIPLDPRRSSKARALASTPPRPNSNVNNNNNAVTMSSNNPNNVVRTTSFEQKQNRIPKNPRDSYVPRETAASSASAASPHRGLIPSSNASLKSARSVPNISTTPSEYCDPASQEQALFEQRLCEDTYGVAVRKINQNGKAQLRYVKCVTLDAGDLDETASATSKSVASLVRNFSRRKRSNSVTYSVDEDTDKLLSTGSRKALMWGKKRDHKMPLDKFVSVRTGKTTERSRKNPQPAARLLSLITKDAKLSLDIEAPTRLDRDKFARAFARFLQVPLEFDTATDAVVGTHTTLEATDGIQPISAAASAPDLDHERQMYSSSPARSVGETPDSKEAIQPGASLGILAAQTAAALHFSQDEEFDDLQPSQNASSSVPSFAGKEFIAGGEIVSGFSPDAFKKEDAPSALSSLTGGNYDQDIVEELHQALENVKAELEGSRAEAARAVKVAEQAIQSAENSGSKDWNSTVTHKAAEAAALAQKRSAEAMAKQRLAEERLAGERKNASFWRSQAEVAEEEAGVLQTRAAAAEVQRAAMIEDLDSERQKTQLLISTLKTRFASSEVHKREALESAIERNRALEIELSGTRRTLNSKSEETKHLQDELHEVSSSTDTTRQASMRRKRNMLGKNKKKNTDATDSTSLLSCESRSSEVLEIAESMSTSVQSLPAEEVLKLHAEFTAIRLQFELLRRTTSDELKTLPEESQMWAHQAGEALVASQIEVARLRQRLALESSTRRKLLHEVQDLRGAVRVYCRPRPFHQHGTKSLTGTVSLPSNEIVLLHRERLPSATDTTPLTFEFDRIFAPEMDQKEIYSEVDELVLCALDGYNVCLMVYGQSGSGKTHAMLGDVSYHETGEIKIENYGIHLQGAEQLFSVSKYRSERYEDSFSLSVVEVNDERLCDLVAGTELGEARGIVDSELVGGRARSNSKASKSVGEDEAYSQMSSKSRKLEIRTSNDGVTVVQGLVTVKVSSMDDVLELWRQALRHRSLRLKEQGIDLKVHEAASHVIATLNVVSTNIATGVGTRGKIQFVEFAGADLAPHRGSSSKSKNIMSNDNVLAPVANKGEWKYANKSMATVLDVVSARAQFNRSVPYRNSTITHLLQDALEGDAKVMMLLCLSSDPKDMQETASALRFASKMKRVNIGKATKHALLR